MYFCSPDVRFVVTIEARRRAGAGAGR